MGAGLLAEGEGLALNLPEVREGLIEDDGRSGAGEGITQGGNGVQ